MLSKLWNWIEHNRFTIIIPLIMLGVWVYAVGCTPATTSPLDPTKRVTAKELGLEFEAWQAQQAIIMKRFDLAGEDIENQKQAWSDFQAVLMKLATGGVADLPGLLQMVLGGSFVGLLSDRLRASGVIGMQKTIIRKNGTA